MDYLLTWNAADGCWMVRPVDRDGRQATVIGTSSEVVLVVSIDALSA